MATAVGGVPEVVEHGRAGQLTLASDPPAMAAAFRTLMADPEAFTVWRNRAQRGAENFTVQRMAADYTRAYRSLLGGDRRRTNSMDPELASVLRLRALNTERRGSRPGELVPADRLAERGEFDMGEVSGGS